MGSPKMTPVPWKAIGHVDNIPAGRHGSTQVKAQDAANQSETDRERKMEEGGASWRDQAAEGQGSDRASKGHSTDGSGKEEHSKEVRRTDRVFSD